MTEWLIHTFVSNYTATKDPVVRTNYGKLAGWVGVICNVLLSLLKAAIGLFTGSIGVIADAANNLSDASSNLISLLGFKLASMPADKEHPYGHGRFEYLSSLVISAVILAVGLQLCFTSAKRILYPEQTIFDAPLVIIMLSSILLKLWMSAFNNTIGHSIDSGALLAAAIDSRNDCITTATILACSLFTAISGLNIDGFAGFIVGVFIIKSGYDTLKETLSPLLGKTPDPDFVNYIQNKVLSYQHVLGVHDLKVHDYGPGRLFVSLHVEMPSTLDPLVSHEILDQMEFDFTNTDNLDINLHLDPVVEGDPYVEKLTNWVESQKSRIDSHLCFHDFRVVSTSLHKTILFDCEIPFSLNMTDEEIRKRLVEIVLEFEPQAICKIKVDRNYIMTPQD